MKQSGEQSEKQLSEKLKQYFILPTHCKKKSLPEDSVVPLMTPVNKEQLNGKELMHAESFSTATGHLVNSEMWINDLSTPPCCTAQL